MCYYLLIVDGVIFLNCLKIIVKNDEVIIMVFEYIRFLVFGV